MVRGELAMTKKKKPDRDWKEYNEHLVQRGEILGVGGDLHSTVELALLAQSCVRIGLAGAEVFIRAALARPGALPTGHLPADAAVVGHRARAALEVVGLTQLGLARRRADAGR